MNDRIQRLALDFPTGRQLVRSGPGINCHRPIALSLARVSVACIITTTWNLSRLDFLRSTAVFLGDVPAATAILDRFLAHAAIVQMTGESYRLRQRTAAGDA